MSSPPPTGFDRSRRWYNRDEIAHVIARYPVATTRVIAAEIGRSPHSVRYLVKKMQLKRTARQKSQIYSTWSRRPKTTHQVAAV